MSAASWIAITLLSVVFGCGVYDVMAHAFDLETVSSVVHRWGLRFPVLPLLTGLLMGHFFWPSDSKPL